MMAGTNMLDKISGAVASVIDGVGRRIRGMQGKSLATAEAVKLCIVLFIAIVSISLAIRMAIPGAPGVIL